MEAHQASMKRRTSAPSNEDPALRLADLVLSSASRPLYTPPAPKTLLSD